MTNHTDLAARFEAKRIEAAGFADEQESCYDGPTGPIEAQYRTEARTWAAARDMARAGAAGGAGGPKDDEGQDWSHLSPHEIVRRTRCQADDGTLPGAGRWRSCCDLILSRLGPAPSSSIETAGHRDAWVTVPRDLTDEMRETLHDRVLIRCDVRKREALIINDQEWWTALIAAAPPPPAQQGSSSPPLTAERVDLVALSDAASQGEWSVERMENHGTSPADRFFSYGIECGPHTILDTLNSSGGMLEQEHDEDSTTAWDEQARRDLTYIAALVNAHRSKRLIEAPVSGEVKS